MLSNRNKHTLEIAAIFTYATLLAIISYFHEPWFDEAQAWLIARDSSLTDMIWNVLRYEGHTPLWHLSLFIPAHLGIPFEIGLKSVNFIFAVLAVAVFIKYSPFPLLVRLLTPFTYFLFYQYGVINRCYSLFMLILWLTAAVFPRRNERPFLFSILLALLGGVTAYGMLIAFGIALAWLIEIIITCRKNIASFSKTIVKTTLDRRFHSLILMGIINTFYVAILWPMPDRYTPLLEHHFTAAERISRLLMAPVGALFLSEPDEFLTTGFNSPLSIFVIIVGFFLIVAFILWAVKKGSFYYVVLPYFVMAIFMTFFYFSIHHTGIFTLLIIFVFWISSDMKNRFSTPQWAYKSSTLSSIFNNHRRIFKAAGISGLICILSLQLYWSYTAIKNDILLPYAPYRELASFMHKYEIDKFNIFDYYYISNEKNTYHTNNLAALSYFPSNIFYNHNPYNKDIGYAAHRRLNDNILIEYLKASEMPDFILWHRDKLPFYSDLFSLSDYSPFKAFESFYMWKDQLNPDSIIIYIRKDLLPQFSQITIQKD